MYKNNIKNGLIKTHLQTSIAARNAYCSSIECIDAKVSSNFFSHTLLPPFQSIPLFLLNALNPLTLIFCDASAGKKN